MMLLTHAKITALADLLITTGAAADSRAATDLLASTLAVESGAKLLENAAPDKPFALYAAFGEQLTDQIENGQKLGEDGVVLGHLFDSRAEVLAYMQGLDDADGFLSNMVVVDASSPGREEYNQFLEALRENPEISFVDWFNENAANQDEDGEE